MDVALDLLEALVAFHPDGLIHRDIKPRNVMLTRAGAKLLDFNIASRFGDPVHTQSGTPPYQPPDADLTSWDVSTDLFAVGVLLYQLLCNGSHPYPNAMPVVDGAVTDPRTFRSDLGADLAQFLVKACAPASGDRFSTAEEMRLALRDIRAHLWTGCISGIIGRWPPSLSASRKLPTKPTEPPFPPRPCSGKTSRNRNGKRGRPP